VGRSDHFYDTAGWKRRRAHQLMVQPLCALCLAEGRNTPASVADHVEPHGGDYTKFVLNPLQSLCVTCHNVRKQRFEHCGFSGAVGLDGWPLDKENHPTWINERKRQQQKK
jgi:5-methylcytosine-specific restriction protein A